MQEQLKKRVEALKAEYQTGQKQLSTLEQEAQRLKETLLRISGAIQVLEEELGAVEGDGKDDV